MAKRRVTCSNKDSDGDITGIGGPGWSTITKAQAIIDIEGKTHTYYVCEAGYESDVYIVSLGGNKHLRTTADQSNKNNLDNLPSC